MTISKTNLKQYFHAVQLNRDKCVGCTKCVRVCPTEAIRVRGGKAQIDPNRCIDCGQCIEVCPVNALYIKKDPLDEIDGFKYKVAIISASYTSQFREEIGFEKGLKALYHMGFDEFAEQAWITDIAADIIRDYIRTHPTIRPVLSSNCPAIVRLIQVRFPSLLTNLLHIETPLSMLAKYCRDKIIKDKKLKEEDIGIFLIVPSASQITAVHQPEGTYSNLHDGAIAICDVYAKAMSVMKEVEQDDRSVVSCANGRNWAISGMEADDVAADDIRTLYVNGIHNVIDVLSNIESHRLDQYEYIELRNCYQGCVGGNLNVENPFVAKARIKNIASSTKRIAIDKEYFFKLYKEGYFDVIPLEPRSIMELDKDVKTAITMMKKVKEILQVLPGFDCGVCGSPTCKALAEDIVQGKADVADCLVRKRTEPMEESPFPTD